jgi:DNA-binding NtrC family response regulator
MPTTVLVVEDDALVSAAIASSLVDEGFAVKVADSADDALRHLDEGVDILFTDINLSGTADGVVLAREVRRLRPDLPVVYASGTMTGSDLGSLVSMSVFLSKPYDPRQVCALLRRLTSARH